MRSATLRSRVPWHLLHAAPSTIGQVRWNSSSSSQNSDGRTAEESDTAKAESSPGSGGASAFGFQSLSGLLRRTSNAERSRYNRASDEPVQGLSEDSKNTSAVIEGSNDRLRKEASDTAMDDLATSNTIINEQDRSVFNWPPVVRQVSEEEATASNLVRFQNSPSPIPRAEQRSVDGLRRAEARRKATVIASRSRRLPNPFSTRRVESRMKSHGNRRPQVPWGLSEETVASPLEPTRDDVQDDSKKFEDVDSAVNTAAVASQDSASISHRTKLTHVKSTGEAHMVDVGPKASTRRVAIASGVVAFSNPHPFQLIFENANKKGDVLGVARIAGIMAAKRTSDLIPLCHPLALSKVEIDVKLHAPKVATAIAKVNEHGIVTIEAHVETTGPTGVEMEALTAASGACLTVYDMCKAVDREMRISTIALRYKSGGKSGLFCDQTWAARIGRKFFMDRNLQLPKIREWVEDKPVADP